MAKRLRFVLVAKVRFGFLLLANTASRHKHPCLNRADYTCCLAEMQVAASSFDEAGRRGGIRTPDLFRVKEAL